MSDEQIEYFTFDEIVRVTSDAEGIGWTEVFRNIWDDDSSQRHVIAYANDMLGRGGVCIPIEIERDPWGALRVIDGHKRVHAAWILQLEEIPAHITETGS